MAKKTYEVYMHAANEPDYYEPSEEELRELEDMIRKEEEDELKSKESKTFEKYIAREKEVKPKNRLIYEFKTESHWQGWLKIHGIKW